MSKLIKLSDLTAIIFDLGGVILNLDYNLTINAFKKLGGERFDELYTQAHQDKIFDQLETGKINSSDFIDYMKQFLPGDVSSQNIVDAWNAMLLDLPPYRIKFLQELKNSHQIFLFSNTNEIHFHRFSDHIDKRFGDRQLLDKIFVQTYYSHKVGERKPDAAAFKKVITDHQLNPSKTLFIDDSEQHIIGASKVGLQTKHLIHEDIIDIFDRSNL